MAPYSMDLRRRVFKAFETCGDADDVAATFGVSAPLGTFSPEEYASKPWWPTVSYTFNRVNQFSANHPIPELSGFFNGAFGNNNEPVSAALPHLITTSNTALVAWNGERWNAMPALALMVSFFMLRGPAANHQRS